MAQVDKSTVSRALNGTGRVSEETRQRIVAAASELGYQPSRLAQGFRTGSSTIIGVVVASLSDPGTADLVSAVLEVLDPMGYSVLLAESHHDGSSTPRSLDFPIDGAIVLPGINAEHRRRLRTRGIPLIDARSCGTDSPQDEYPTSLEGYRTLVRLGHQHIGMIELASEVAEERHVRRRDAAEDAIHESPLHAVGEAGLRPVEVVDARDAYAAASSLIADRLITALSVGTDSLIAPVLQAMYDAGVPVGTGLSLLGVAHSTSTVEAYPSLSFLSHDSWADGRHLARRILGELGVHDAPAPSLGSDVHEAHWHFHQRASVTTSPVTPNC